MPTYSPLLWSMDAVSEITLLVKSAKVFAGIGSRGTPPEVLVLMQKLGVLLAEGGLMLRSGGSSGADAAFERGFDHAGGNKEIFLPWRAFNGNHSPLYLSTTQAFQMAELAHPAWHACSPAARKLHARNCHQVLGKSLLEPVDFILYWAPEKDGAVEGGTATAITLARAWGIRCFNLREEPTFWNWQAFEARVQGRCSALLRAILGWNG